MPSFCLYFNRGHCRSCAWIEQPYKEQIAQKVQLIREALSGFLPFQLEDPVLSTREGFRNRAKMTVTGTVDSPIVGLIGESELDEGRELLSCPIHHPKLNEMIAALPGWIQEYALVPYRIKERKGELKGVIAYYSPVSDQMYLRFILRSRECVSRIQKLIPVIQEKFSSIACISANLQPIPHAILEGREEILLTERKSIDHTFVTRNGPVTLTLAPQAFVQTNFEVATELYQTAADWIKEAGPEKVLELFSGQGAFSLFSARSASRLIGIEINPDAVRAANETVQKLGLTHLSFKAADATKVSQEIEEFQPDLILANPPRRGLAEGVELIRRHRPAHFIYSSCALDTLASDLEKLKPEYRVKKTRLFDMFAHTEHFETLVWLERI